MHSTSAFTLRPLTKAGLSALLALAAHGAAAQTADLLVLYTPEALQTRNGADINARIASYVAYANQAYANSKVDLRLRLVGAELLDVPYRDVTSQNLDRLRQDSQVAQLRRKYGADFVTLLNLRHATSGGYVCGIGYLPSGTRTGGQLSSNANAVAYSLVGIDCGLSTMAHELGHNMGLGHSQIQNSNGSVWAWARGYGVQGVFSTIMAYPQAYGTNNQLAIFSNPALTGCQGLPCGVDRSRGDGADSAAAINLLGAQLANFMPTVTAVDGGQTPAPTPSPTPAPTPTPGPTPTPAPTPAPTPTPTPTCAKPAVSGNLIQNGEFDGSSGWRSGFGLSRLSVVALPGAGCVDNALLVSHRSERHSSAYQPLTQSLRANTRYRFSARLGIRNASREEVRVALYVQDGSGARYVYLDPVSVTANELTAVSREFELSANSNAGLLIYGPPAGVDIVVDSVALVPTGAANIPSAPTDSAVVVNEPFERTAVGWRPYSSGSLSYSTNAASGRYGLRASRRASRSSGPSLDLAGLLESGGSYRLRASAYVPGAADTVQVWLYYTDSRGGHWQSLENTTVAANSWQELSGTFNIEADGSLMQARLIFMGPSRGRDLYLDDVILEKR